MLTVKDLEAGYGKKQVLFGLSLEVEENNIVALIGPNGTGKSTILKVVCGLISAWKGEIQFCGMPINGSSPAKNVTKGIIFSPQGSRVFHGLTVFENLKVGAFQLPLNETRLRIAEVLEVFPMLKGRMKQDAGRLSGGEQQMLALARALLPKPKLLMLDEPSLGLSPALVNTILDKIIQLKKDLGVTILVVEQKVREVLNICDRVYSIKLGKVAFEGIPADLKENKAKLKELFL